MRASHYNSRTRAELTERQRDVLGLIAKGKTNPQIADALGMTLDGAKFHVSEILTKLGVSTREEAAAWWREERSLKRRTLRGMAWRTGGGRWLAVGGSALAVAVIGGGLAAWTLMETGDSKPPDSDVVFQLTPPGGAPEIVIYSPEAHAIVHQFAAPVDGSGNAWTPAASAGNSIAFVSKDFRVMVRDLDGGNERIIYKSASQYAIPGVEASPDGHYFAILDNPSEDVAPIVSIFDASTGEQIVRVEAPILAGGSKPAVPLLFSWHTDSRGVTLEEMTNEPGTDGASPAGFATIGLDGSVPITQAQSNDMVSPDGRFVAEPDLFDPAKCGYLGSESSIRIVEIATGKTVAHIDDPQGRLSLSRWAADSSAVSYQIYDAPDCIPQTDDAAWWALPVDGGSPHRISGQDALEGPGRGPLMQVDCGFPWIDTLTQPSYGPLRAYNGDCLSFTRDTLEPVPSKYNNVGHMLIDGHLAFLFDSFQFIGFVTPSASDTTSISPTAPVAGKPSTVATASTRLGSCAPGVPGSVCSFALDLPSTVANPAALAALVNSGAPTAYTCAANGTTTTVEFTNICAGQVPGDVIRGFPLARHGSEGDAETAESLTETIAAAFAPGAPSIIATIGCPLISAACTEFVVAFATGTQPSALYLAFQTPPGGTPVLTGAGLSGDNADTILHGGTTTTVVGQTYFVALPP